MDSCRLCGEEITPLQFDGIEGFRDRNPETFRMALMHYDCFSVALETAEETESSNNSLYSNRSDEYYFKFL